MMVRVVEVKVCNRVYIVHACDWAAAKREEEMKIDDEEEESSCGRFVQCEGDCLLLYFPHSSGARFSSHLVPLPQDCATHLPYPPPLLLLLLHQHHHQAPHEVQLNRE